MSKPQTLYRMYDTLGTLLYIGITQQQSRRFDQHNQDKPWWSEVAEIRVQHYPDRRAVEIAELAAIAAEHPRYNVIGNHCGTFPLNLEPHIRISLAILHGHHTQHAIIKCAGGNLRKNKTVLAHMTLTGSLTAMRVGGDIGGFILWDFTDRRRVIRNCEECGAALRTTGCRFCPACALRKADRAFAVDGAR